MPTRSLSALCLALLFAGWGWIAAPASAQPDDENAENIVHDPAHFDELDYRMIGPYRGGRSTAVTGIPGGDPDHYLMGAVGGGVWQTTNAGQNWSNISDGYFDVGAIGSVAVSKADPNVVYAGTGSACIRGNVSTGRGIYRSMDGGETWSFIGLPEAGQIGDIKIHPENPDLVYVAALGHPFGKNEQRGVFRSTDGGDTWDKVLFLSDSTGVVDLAMNPNNPREIYASAWRAERKPWTIISGGAPEGGIYKTTDGGDNWDKLGGGLPSKTFGKSAVTVSPAKPNRVWAIVEAKEPEGGVYRSDNRGTTWTRVNRDRDLRQRAYYYIHIEADPQDPNTVYVLNVGLHRSVDGGESFDRMSVPHGDVHDLWINPEDPTTMVVANDGGAQVSHDQGETWSTYYNQPTAEFYSVEVDNQFPYRVYGPQQDNSTISLPSWREGNTTPKEPWMAIGGCETGPISFHPDNPNLIYAGCYGGTITRWNKETGQTRNVMVYPQLQLGQAPKNLRERFQWVSPIVVSPHDPDVVYHASHRIWRSEDGGMSWSQISDDLTTDTPKHQEFGGKPITNEGTGVEVYNTVFSLRVSPHSAQTLWAGTDDGRVWISRDEGGSWSEITPDDMPEQGTVNRIDVSPHEAGKAYMAVYRYRMDDWSPYIFQTTNYGEDWTLLTTGDNGIPADHPTRVVREDPDREGLLYAGTEFGMFVSFDDGAHWQSFQQNLPATPITDLKVHKQDLVVATQGRSFWIMDNLTPLHDLTDAVASADHHLVKPRAAYLVSPSGGWGEYSPEGPPRGAQFHYFFEETPEETVTLEVLNPQGEVIRSFTSDSSAAEEADEPVLPVEAGLNNFSWDMVSKPVDTVDGAIVWGYTGGVKALPGTYELRLSVGDESQTQSFEVRKDPRLTDVTRQDLVAQHDMATTIRDTLNSVYDSIRMLRMVREQVQSTMKYAKEAEMSSDELTAMADSVTQQLTAVEQELIQTNAESFQDVINYPPQLDNQFAYLYGYVAGPNGRPTEGAQTRFDDLNAQWADLRTELQSIMDTELAQFNQMVRDQVGSQPVLVPATSDRR